MVNCIKKPNYSSIKQKLHTSCSVKEGLIKTSIGYFKTLLGVLSLSITQHICYNIYICYNISIAFHAISFHAIIWNMCSKRKQYHQSISKLKDQLKACVLGTFYYQFHVWLLFFVIFTHKCLAIYIGQTTLSQCHVVLVFSF